MNLMFKDKFLGKAVKRTHGPKLVTFVLFSMMHPNHGITVDKIFVQLYDVNTLFTCLISSGR